MSLIVIVALGVALVFALVLWTAQPPSISTFTIFAAGASNPPTSAFEYKGNFGLGKRQPVLSTDGTRGTRSHPGERTRAAPYAVSGPISMQPGPTDLDFWLPYILGGAPSGSGTVTYPLGESLSSFYVGIDRIAQQHLYNGCVIDKATFKASHGSFLDMDLDIEALTETLGVISGLDALAVSKTVPYVLTDATLTIASTTYQFASVQIVIDNHLKKDRWMNAIARTDLPATDRTVSVSLSLPYTTDEVTLYGNTPTGVSVVVTFTNGSSVLVFTMASVQFPTEPPAIAGKDEILLPYDGIARTTGSTKELVVTNHD